MRTDGGQVRTGQVAALRVAAAGVVVVVAVGPLGVVVREAAGVGGCQVGNRDDAAGDVRGGAVGSGGMGVEEREP